MPKKPPRDNPRNRAVRTVQSAATLLRRISQKTGVVPPPLAGLAAGTSHIDVLRGLLPDGLGAHLVTCLVRPSELVLFADSAGWAARLRVAAAEIAETGALIPIAGENPRITVRIAPRPAR
jgi:hypothetical protein